MSKELTPLEALERIVDTYYIDNMDKEISIIETALKNYETDKMYTCDEFREFVYKNDFKSVKNIELAFNSLIKRNNKLKKQITEKNKIEEELGIDLITLFKALKNGIYTNKWLHKTKYGIDLERKRFESHCSGDYGVVETSYFYFKDYGKTWVLDKKDLTKEELENV